jgi:lipoprotein-releasing system permease protein
MSFPLVVALRFLREGRAQSLLILAGAGVGVAVLIFLSSLIESLQTSLIKQTLGSQAHVVVRPGEEVSRPVIALDGDRVMVRSAEQPAQRLRSLPDGPRVKAAVDEVPGVVASAAVVSGAAQASRGQARRAVTLRGIEPADFDRIISLTDRMKEGTAMVQGDGALIGTELAADLGAHVGDRLRLLVDEDHTATVRIQGIFDLGAKDVNLRWVLVPLRQAQALLSVDGGISLIECRVDDIFAANAVAAAIGDRTGLVADSWMTLNAQLMVALQSQGSSSNMIQAFVILAVALGIASVLVVSVVQKKKEIGILRAMGASRSQVNRVFLWQGAIVGVAGSIVGTSLGLLLLFGFRQLPLTFVIESPPSLIARACLIALATGVVSALVPARQAAKLDPAEAIRG